MKKVLLLFTITLSFILVGCGKKKYETNTITAKSLFSSTTISLTCECEIIPSDENAIFFYTNNSLLEMKDLITDATVYDESISTQITFLKDGYYFVLKEKFTEDKNNRYVLGCDYSQIVVEMGVEHYSIPFPQYISPVYYVSSNTIASSYKEVLENYYENVSGFTIEMTNEKIVIKNVKNSFSSEYSNISINFGSEITITVDGV